MRGRTKFSLVLVGSLCCIALCGQRSVAQQVESSSIRDAALGITFQKTGSVEKIDNAGYRMTLVPPENSTIRAALAQVTATDRLFVDLPGSYGGKLYLDTPSASKLIHSRVFVDSLNTGQELFRREYWIVYAGMGMWEGVINCTTQEGGRNYVVALTVEIPVGKPGEEIDGVTLTTEDLKANVLRSLQDPTNALVNEFSTLVHSVQITK